MLSLDIGCGGSEQFKTHRVRGGINCDILKPYHKIENFVLCDAQFLPFKANCFIRIFMYDLIEHIENPLRSLKEAKRILNEKGILEIGTPNSLYIPKIVRSIFRGFYSVHKDHISTWGKTELSQLLSKIGFKFRIEYRTYFDMEKPLHYKLVVWICPFPALKHRQLYCECSKDPKFYEH